MPQYFFEWYPEVEKLCREVFQDAEKDYDFGIYEMGFDKNHVHLYVEITHKYSVAEIVKVLKGRSGHEILKRYPKIKKKYFYGSGFWNPAYYFESVGDTTTGHMRNYVRKQGKIKVSDDRVQTKMLDFISA